MTGIAPYIPEHDIEFFAWIMLGKMYPDGVPVPVPVEEIAEQHYKIPVEYEEFKEAILGYSDVLKGKIWINSLMMGNDKRLRFTLAHELGHYSFCQYYMKQADISYSQFPDFYKHNYCRVETHANIFAGYLLMPTPLVFQKWIEVTGDYASYSLRAERERNEYTTKQLWDYIEADPLTRDGTKVFRLDSRSEELTQSMADVFEVSFQCAEIQLKKLGFLFYNRTAFMRILQMEQIGCTNPAPPLVAFNPCLPIHTFQHCPRVYAEKWFSALIKNNFIKIC